MCSCALNYFPKLGIPIPEARISKRAMIEKSEWTLRLLIVEDVQETREAIEKLLKRDGYIVDQAKDEAEAAEKARRNSPDLILVSLAGTPYDVLSVAQRIRLNGGLTQKTPIVIFSLWMVPQGTEEELSENIYVTVPDNFNQLRALLARILRSTSNTH
jgi:CheY-like chemotaxis protein